MLRTLFGKLRLDSPRLYRCGCCNKEEHRGFSPLAELLPGRTAPELAYLENKFAAMISYGLTAKLLAEVLPTGGNINVVFSHPQALQIILTSDDSKEFEASGEQNAIFEPLLGSQSVIGLSGDRHRRIRKLMMPPFHGERMRGMLCRNWREMIGCGKFPLAMDRWVGEMSAFQP